jgi:hypothetical protein
MVVDDEIAQLYAVPPDEFVAARNALAKRLKGAGDREAAASVAALRRPPVSAWALNEVARREPDRVSAMLGAAAVLSAALAGDGSTDVRTAQRDFRARSDDLAAAAGRVVSDAGRGQTEAIQRQIQATVGAAAVDASVADELRAARLASDHEAFGFTPGADAVAPSRTPRAKAARAPAPAREKAPAPAPAADDELARERRRRDKARQARLAELDRGVERLRRRAERLATAAEKAELEAAARRSEADDASRDVDAAVEARRAAERDG